MKHFGFKNNLLMPLLYLESWMWTRQEGSRNEWALLQVRAIEPSPPNPSVASRMLYSSTFMREHQFLKERTLWRTALNYVAGCWWDASIYSQLCGAKNILDFHLALDQGFESSESTDQTFVSAISHHSGYQQYSALSSLILFLTKIEN